MKITMTPPIRTAFERASIETVYTTRLLELFGNEANARKAHDEWHRLHQPPVHHWLTYNAIARIEAGIVFLPSERKNVSFIVEFENE